METNKPVYVQGYIRNKKTQTKIDNSKAALIFLAAVATIMLVVYWRLTLTMALAISLAVFGKKYYQFVNDPDRLIVNYFGSTLTERIWDNVKGTLREQLKI